MFLMKKMPSRLAWLWRKGIGFRLAMMVALNLLPFVALSGFIYHQRYEVRRNLALQTESEVAQGLAVTFAAYLQGIHKQNLSVGHAIAILAPPPDHMVELLMTSVGDSVSVRDISWVSRDGVVLASSVPGTSGLDISRSPVYRGVTAGGKMVLGDLEADGAISHKPSVPLATAIRDFRGVLQGAVVAEIDPGNLENVVVPHKGPTEASLTLFDNRGSVVYHLETAQAKGRWRPGDPLLMRALRTRLPQTGTRVAAQDEADLNYLSALAPVPGVGWLAAASGSTRIAFADVRRGVLLDTLLAAAAFSLAFLLAYLLGRNIVAPLRRLEDDARLMVDGKAIPVEDPFAPREVSSLRRTMHGMAADLTSRADELRESEELFRAIFESVYDGVLIHDRLGHIVKVNQRWLEMVQMTAEEAKGLTISDISAAPPPAEELYKLWDEVLAGENKLFEWPAKRPGDNYLFDVEVFLCPIRYQGEYLIMANVRDITERKRVARELQEYRDQLELKVKQRTEELAKAVEEIQKETAQRVAAMEELRSKEQLLIQQGRLAAMGEMMANVAHQWRQPLNLLGLIVQELKISYQKGNFTGELLLNSATKAMTVISHMSQTIDDFRNLLSPDKARTTFTAKEVVDKVLSMLQVKAEVQVIVEEDCPMEGSRNEYSQVIINILANARDVFNERRIENPAITIRVKAEKEHCVVTIADNGGGIAPEILDRIFDPYFTTKGPDKGTGLGLFMSKTIIEKSMNGRLTARNVGAGAEFRIEV